MVVSLYDRLEALTTQGRYLYIHSPSLPSSPPRSCFSTLLTRHSSNKKPAATRYARPVNSCVYRYPQRPISGRRKYRAITSAKVVGSTTVSQCRERNEGTSFKPAISAHNGPTHVQYTVKDSCEQSRQLREPSISLTAQYRTADKREENQHAVPRRWDPNRKHRDCAGERNVCRHLYPTKPV